MKASRNVLRCALLTPIVAIAAQMPGTPADYPRRPIRLVVPQSPGGTNDILARLIAPALSESLGQLTVIDNRPGAGAMLGIDLVAKAVPDGYTLLVAPSAFVIIPSMYKNVPFDPVTNFAAVTTLSSYPYMVVVHPSVPATSIKELIALAKSRPGALNFASGGLGTGTHLDGELFKSRAGVHIVHVPYKGGGPALTAVLGGEVQIYFASIPPVRPFVKSGKLRALAVTTAKRSPLAPDLPTVAEAALPNFEHVSWNGIVAPAGTPASIVLKLNTELNALLATPALQDRFASEGAEPFGSTAAAFAALIKSEIAKWARVIREAGIKPDQ